jgi:hypothetical protein
VAFSGAVGWTDPADGYDWFCFDATAGVEVTLAVVRTSGDILPNAGAFPGLVAEGTLFGDAPDLEDFSENDASSSVNFQFTPVTTGPYTAYVSTWKGEAGGDYDVTLTGGAARVDCASFVPPLIQEIPTLGGWGFAALAAALAGAALLVLRRS